MNQQEQELFLELCRFERPNKNKLEAFLEDAATPEVLGYLFFHRMAAAAYGVLKETELLGRVNREFRNSLACAQEQNAEKNKSFYRGVSLITDALRGHEEQYAMLKGALLCGRYPEGYRTSNDVDLLVRPADVTQIGELLKRAGFRQGYLRGGRFEAAGRREIIEAKMTRGETVPYLLEVCLPYQKLLEVDVNFSLDYKNGDTDALEALLQHTRQESVQGCTIPTLDACDFFIHLCGHLYKEAATLPWIRMKRDMTLYKYCDIYVSLCRFTPEEIQRVFERAEALHMAEICACAIYWTNALFGTCNVRAQSAAARVLKGKKSLLDEVTAPAEGKRYFYEEHDIQARFFAANRAALLKEVKE